MADGKGLQSRHHQNAAAYLGVELDIVGHLEVVDYRVEHFVHFSARRDQTNALETVNDVVLRLTVPRALRLNRSKVIGCLADRKSTRLNSSHGYISYAVFCLKKKKKTHTQIGRQITL